MSSANLSIARRIGFAIGDFGFNIYYQGVSFFLFIFYTDVMGLPPFWAGFTMFVALFWDGLTDPIMGGIADRTRTRWGRYRPYLLFASPILALSFAAIFYTPPQFSTTALIAYAVITHLLFRTLYTVVNIPFSGLMARMTDHSKERSALAGWRMQFAALGGVTTAFFLPELVGLLGQGRPQLGWTFAAVSLGGFATLIFWICFLATREPAEDKQQTLPPPPSLKTTIEDIKTAGLMLFYNRPLARVFIGILMASLCLSMVSKNVLYWFKYAVGDEEMGRLALVIPAAVLIVMAPIWVWVGNKTSKRTAWLSGCWIALFGYASFFFVPQGNGVLAIIALSLAAVGASAFAVMFWSMLPDTVEYGQWKTGDRHEAKTFGFASFGQKAALGVNALILGLLMQAIGFIANVEQTQQTLDGLKMIMSAIPILGVIATMIALWRYPIDHTFHEKIKLEIKHSSVAVAATPDRP